jgi:hypothetical protein
MYDKKERTHSMKEYGLKLREHLIKALGAKPSLLAPYRQQSQRGSRRGERL